MFLTFNRNTLNCLLLIFIYPLDNIQHLLSNCKAIINQYLLIIYHCLVVIGKAFNIINHNLIQSYMMQFICRFQKFGSGTKVERLKSQNIIYCLKYIQCLSVLSSLREMVNKSLAMITSTTLMLFCVDLQTIYLYPNKRTILYNIEISNMVH